MFPPEVTKLIITNLGWEEMTFSELAKLWVASPVVSAFVSTEFDVEIRKVFAEEILPELTLEYKLGRSFGNAKLPHCSESLLTPSRLFPC